MRDVGLYGVQEVGQDDASRTTTAVGWACLRCVVLLPTLRPKSHVIPQTEGHCLLLMSFRPVNRGIGLRSYTRPLRPSSSKPQNAHFKYT